MLLHTSSKKNRGRRDDLIAAVTMTTGRIHLVYLSKLSFLPKQPSIRFSGHLNVVVSQSLSFGQATAECNLI